MESGRQSEVESDPSRSESAQTTPSPSPAHSGASTGNPQQSGSPSNGAQPAASSNATPRDTAAKPKGTVAEPERTDHVGKFRTQLDAIKSEYLSKSAEGRAISKAAADVALREKVMMTVLDRLSAPADVPDLRGSKTKDRANDVISGLLNVGKPVEPTAEPRSYVLRLYQDV